jgi:hypothetical protein
VDRAGWSNDQGGAFLKTVPSEQALPAAGRVERSGHRVSHNAAAPAVYKTKRAARSGHERPQEHGGSEFWVNLEFPLLERLCSADIFVAGPWFVILPSPLNTLLSKMQ